MASVVHAVRERVQYSLGYLQGRSFQLPRTLSDVYGTLVAKGTSLVSLPLPLLSFLALPLYGGSTATVNLLFFYLTWSALVISHNQLTLELYGTLLIRLFCFLLPALGFLAFDIAVPIVSKTVKARGERQLPARHGRDKLLGIVLVAVCNVLLGVLIHAGLELLFTRVLHLKSLLKVTTVVPLPWSIVKDLLQGLAIRGSLHYAVHRFVLHTNPSILKTWHLEWQHSVEHPFSLVAAYDHPVNHLLADWLPTILPAMLFRWHLLTWFLFLSIASLEELFVFSGYSVLPSAIILPGMARRTEAHFDSVKKGERVGNFGHLGLIDFLLGTTSSSESTIVDDVQDEAKEHQLQERIESAVQAALAGMEVKKSNSKQIEDGKQEGSTDKHISDNRSDDQHTKGEVEGNDGSEEGESADGRTTATTRTRRSGRRKTTKG